MSGYNVVNFFIDITKQGDLDAIVAKYLNFGFSYHPIKDYLDSLVKHIEFVREAGGMIGVHKTQLKVHDQSKFTESEFPFYAEKFFGGHSSDDEQTNRNFSTAWLHHIHHNPHHWQYWMFPDGYSPKNSEVENGIVQMPNVYAKEMVADWMGAEMTYGGSWDMSDWLSKNMPKISVHSKTAVYLRELLDILGYADIVYMTKFANEE